MVKTKILLVEDDKSLREIYGVRLYSEGYDIISAGDGEEALAMAIKERPTLIISDVMMPKISGFDMLDILRSTTETKNIRVIMMTALSSEDQRARGEALGADRYLVKSQVGIEDVVRTVHEVLGDAPVSGMTSAPTPAAPAAAPIPAPVAPVAAAASAMPQPVTPAPVASPQPPQASALPQPTAPFSTNRPASLGDRVIHPLESSQPTVDFGAMMSAELSNAPQPNINPVAPTEPEASTPDLEAELESLIPPIPATTFEQDQGEDASSTMPTPSTPSPAQVIPVPTATPIEAPAMEVPQPTTPQETPAPQALAAPFEPQVPAIEAPAFVTDESVSTLPPEAPQAPAVAAPDTSTQPQTVPAGLSFEETPYAPNPVISSEPPVIPGVAPEQPNDEPPIVVPSRPAPGV